MRLPVRAAGGILLRGSGDRRAVALVHRPRYDDWSFPKGKLLEGEDDRTAALREVEEETGLRCRLGRSVGSVTYVDRRGRPKVVRYFEMAGADGAFVPSGEVDEIRWLPVGDALRALSYPHDRDLLRRVIAGVAPSSLYVVRHAKAGERSSWDGWDAERPLDRRGWEQAHRLVERFQGLDVERIVSSPAVRCVQTVEPLADARGLPIETVDALAEGRDPELLVALVRALDPRPTVLCGHGDEIRTLIDRLERGGASVEEPRGIAKGSVWVLERQDGTINSARYLPAPSG